MNEDWERVLGDFREAAATGREPEDVQAERHARDRAAVDRATRRTSWIKRALAGLFYEAGPVCFACGRRGAQPCTGHEYGGTIIQSRFRRFTPWWVGRFVDCRWGWPTRGKRRAT